MRASHVKPGNWCFHGACGARSSIRNLVDATLRYLIERVGGVEGTYPTDDGLPDDFLARRTAGNAVELLGIVAFRASPVWVLAAMADVCGLGRQLIPEIADALKAEGLLEEDRSFESVDELLDGLERTSSRLASAINTPPLDVPGLREEWRAIKAEARSLRPANLPARESIGAVWEQLTAESIRQSRSVFETSSMMAVSAARQMPDSVRWLSASTRVGGMRTGRLFGVMLLEHYRETLDEIGRVGFSGYATRQLRPYLHAAVTQFSPSRGTATERALARRQRRRSP